MDKAERKRQERKERKERAAEAAQAPVSPSSPPMGTPAKVVALIVAAGLLAMLAWTVVWRAEHPSLVEKPRQSRAQASSQGMPGDPQQNMGMITALMEKLKENPDDVHTLHTLAEQFMRMQAWDRAEALLERAVVADPTNGSVLNLMGIVEFNLKRYRDAADKFELLLEQAPDDLMARYNLGVLYGHFLEDKDKAVEYFQSVVDAENAPEDMRKEAAGAIKALP